jgi:hypothetical protein
LIFYLRFGIAAVFRKEAKICHIRNIGDVGNPDYPDSAPSPPVCDVEVERAQRLNWRSVKKPVSIGEEEAKARLGRSRSRLRFGTLAIFIHERSAAVGWLNWLPFAGLAGSQNGFDHQHIAERVL